MLQLFGAGAALLAAPRWARAARPNDDFFVFVHAAGGWDVTLWADPRNEREGLVDPAASDNTDTAGLTHWKPTALDGDVETFTPLTSSRNGLVLGPGIGALADLRDRLTVINGLAMNTVSHPDGIAYSATGRHLAGARVPASSIDVAIANELGTAQLLPAVAIQFPSAFVGERLDRRAIPLRVASAATLARSLARSSAYFVPDDRAAISAVLTEEAEALAKRSVFPETYGRIASQQRAQPQMIGGALEKAFTQKALQDAYPGFDYKAKTQAAGALSAAFAVAAIERNLVRSVGFALGGLDTHNQNYRQHARTLQELFGVIAQLIAVLDATPHPTRSGAKLADHTHVLVFSEFCRTPQINLSGGRDHYPNNSALVISPRFRGGLAFGKTDREQLLPADAKTFADGARPIAPPDLLATFLHAFAIDPRLYLRDGEVVPELLR
ncbi:MAG TPA: DUF1501 domain-containing protein [Kofleriaceae bacterium]|nr:DUF1501 domain-containing protein [Kofleriaceae bacterium]